MKNIKIRFMALLALTALITTAAFSDFFSGIGKLINPEGLIKTAGIGIIVSQFGPKIDGAVNSLTGHHSSDKHFTKVVPILTVGSKSAIGAVQVMGPKKDVEKVSAVAQVETKVPFLSNLRVRALIPVSSKKIIDIKRIPNVGVSAILDLKL